MISWYSESTVTSTSPPTTQSGAGSAASFLEERLHPIQTFHERVDVGGRAVEMHRGARGGGHAVAQAGWPRAVVADPDGDAALIQQLAHVVGVDAVEGERDRAATVVGRGRADDAEPLDLLQRAEGVAGELVLVLADRVHAELGEVVDRGAEADGLGDHRGARLELVRQHGPGRAGHRDLVDYLAAAEERG